MLFKGNLKDSFKDVEENGVFSEKKLKTPQKEIYKVGFFIFLKDFS